MFPPLAASRSPNRPCEREAASGKSSNQIEQHYIRVRTRLDADVRLVRDGHAVAGCERSAVGKDVATQDLEPGGASVAERMHHAAALTQRCQIDLRVLMDRQS